MAAKLIDVRAEGRQRIDRYDLVAEIASGGMATVFLARLSGVGGFQRFVAIKRLHPHLAREDEFVQMFLDEARLAAGIHHPNVVPILEVGASGRGYYLVMEYIEGDTLARLLARAASGGAALPLDISLRIVVDMLAGLHAAHELRDDHGQPTELVHRDVSPQNVLVGADGISRITDFGVARAAQRLSATRAGQLKGKIAYMAPEQAAGEKVDRRADVFASGIVLWEVLCAKRLFKAENEAATLNRVLMDPIPSPREHVPNLPQELADVCMKALAREASDRFATCAQFADALERATSEASLRATIASPRAVAEYVAEVIGNEIREQREAVRAWLAFSEPSRMAHPSSPLAAAVPPRAESNTSSGTSLDVGEPTVASGVLDLPWRRPRRRGLTVGVVLLLLVGLVGVIAFSLGEDKGPEQAPVAGGSGEPARTPPPPPPPPAASAPAGRDAGAAPEPPPTRRRDSGRVPSKATPTEGDDFLRNPYR